MDVIPENQNNVVNLVARAMAISPQADPEITASILTGNLLAYNKDELPNELGIELLFDFPFAADINVELLQSLTQKVRDAVNQIHIELRFIPTGIEKIDFYLEDYKRKLILTEGESLILDGQVAQWRYSIPDIDKGHVVALLFLPVNTVKEIYNKMTQGHSGYNLKLPPISYLSVATASYNVVYESFRSLNAYLARLDILDQKTSQPLERLYFKGVMERISGMITFNFGNPKAELQELASFLRSMSRIYASHEFREACKEKDDLYYGLYLNAMTYASGHKNNVLSNHVDLIQPN